MCRSRSRFFASRISGQNDRVVFRVIAARYSNYAKLQRKRRIQKIAFAGIRRVTRLQSRLVTTYRPNTASERYNFFWTESFFTVTQASGVALISRREISRPSSRSKKRSRINYPARECLRISSSDREYRWEIEYAIFRPISVGESRVFASILPIKKLTLSRIFRLKNFLMKYFITYRAWWRNDVLAGYRQGRAPKLLIKICFPCF